MSRGRDESLVRAAARRLSEGPTHTLELAREVLGLSGHPGAASAAVFQLLGADRRFSVDADGNWKLDAEVTVFGAPLREIPFAVVDVETTGGASWRGHRIIEVAIVEVKGGEIVGEYETLVNPGQGIPPAIGALTGITSEMVGAAPYFEHIADEVGRRLEGRVFVAHNAMFDWSFVAAELTRAAADVPDVPRLCTVRMCRRLLTGLPRRNLDVVCRHFDIPNHARHRAYGDALATARVLLRLLDEVSGRGVEDLATLKWYLRQRRTHRRVDPRQFRLDGL